MGKGKKDKKDGKKAKKASPVPKEVGGVKLPKPMRKAGKAALKAAQNPAVSETVAAALLAAAAALREGKGVRQGAKAAGVAAADAVDQATRDMTGLGSMLRGIAIDVARKTIDAWAAEEKADAGEAPRGGGKKAKRQAAGEGVGEARQEPAAVSGTAPERARQEG